MRVLIVNRGMYVYGGAELLIVKLANYMTNKGIENALLTTSIMPEMQKDLTGTEIIIPQLKNPQLKKSSVSEILTLHKGVRDNLNNFSVINVHNYPAELSVFPYHKPVVWMCNEPDLYLWLELKLPFSLKLRRKTLLAFDKFVVRHYIKNVVVADEFNAERFKKIYNITPYIINYGIDHAFFSQGYGEKVKERFNLYDNFTLIQVGMLTTFKNQIESIKTIEKLRDKIPNVKLVLAGWGEGEYIEMLQRYVHTKSLDQYVIFTGHLSRNEIRDLYHACDVALFPIKSQGGWLSPFEALCAKVPIIVSPLMTASSIIKRNRIGIVTDNFVNAVMDIYNDPEKYYSIAKNGSVWVEKNLSWDNFCEKMVVIFEEVI